MSSTSGPNSIGSSPSLTAAMQTTDKFGSLSTLLNLSTAKDAFVPVANRFFIPSGPEISTNCTPNSKDLLLQSLFEEQFGKIDEGNPDVVTIFGYMEVVTSSSSFLTLNDVDAQQREKTYGRLTLFLHKD
jgi:hypothetical protein